MASRSDGKRPEGMTHFLADRQISSVVCTSAVSYLDASARETVAAAELAATRKTAKHANIQERFVFYPIAVETQGPLNESAAELFGELGRRTSDISGDQREACFLFQRISVLIQRFNAILLHDSFSPGEGRE